MGYALTVEAQYNAAIWPNIEEWFSNIESNYFEDTNLWSVHKGVGGFSSKAANPLQNILYPEMKLSVQLYPLSQN